MVEVFKTYVNDASTAELIIQKIRQVMPLARISFDLDDCDKILRVEGSSLNPAEIIQVLGNMGHYCEVLL